MKYFCPVCGATISPDELDFYKTHFVCKRCHLVKSNELSPKKQYTLYLCSMCLAYIFDKMPKNAQWKFIETQDLNEAISQILKRELTDIWQEEYDTKYDITFPIINEIPSKITVHVTNPHKNAETNEITLLIKSSVCKNCNKMLSRRFDAVIQLRTIKLKSEKPETILEPLLTEIIDFTEAIQSKNPDQFISDIDTFSHGFDLKLSNKAMMNAITSYLLHKYPFIVKTSKKLMGKNPTTGGNLYRSYVLLRYLPFRTNTQIRIKNNYYSIQKIHSNQITLENIIDHKQQTRKFDYFEKKLIERTEV
ncbi:MAG: hypothetical protein JW776_02895 [Candidatus Lokiarchaeota archaeon]|nr:hypothetical protein [Candidatus Lokiarchaeota archaeon]